MFGGIRAVQQKLVDGNFVPANQKNGFADNVWGPNTSAALRRFQQANGLPQTGLMDDATGRRLFGLDAPAEPPPPADGPLKTGQRGPQVEELQGKLIRLGYMTEEQKATGPGIFGPRTESAVKGFQADVKLPPTGEVDAATRRAMNDVISGLGRNTAIKNEFVTKALQDRLVDLKYMTREQVNTGYGTFGPQTEAAVKQFQDANGIAMSGLVGAQTFDKLFDKAAKPNPGQSGNGNTGATPANDTRYYTVNPGILITDALRPRLNEFARRYFEATGQRLHVTSGYRPPARQANAMYDLIINRGQAHVQGLYINQTAVSQILSAYRANSGSRAAAVNAMTRVIERQVANGTYISNHLRSNAIDVSAASNGNTLRRVAAQMGGRILNEGDHFHIEL
jgi:peptidoglycan hydrolase-like protein with peptidoglycan-binding domain